MPKVKSLFPSFRADSDLWTPSSLLCHRLRLTSSAASPASPVNTSPHPVTAARSPQCARHAPATPTPLVACPRHVPPAATAGREATRKSTPLSVAHPPATPCAQPAVDAVPTTIRHSHAPLLPTVHVLSVYMQLHSVYREFFESSQYKHFSAIPCAPQACSTTCPTGSFISTPCTATSDRKCTTCQASCETGQVEATPCTSTSDRVSRVRDAHLPHFASPICACFLALAFCFKTIYQVCVFSRVGFRAGMVQTLNRGRGWSPITGKGVWRTSSSTLPSLFEESNVLDDTGVFTAPLDGVYIVTAQIRLYALSFPTSAIGAINTCLTDPAPAFFFSLLLTPHLVTALVATTFACSVRRVC